MKPLPRKTSFLESSSPCPLPYSPTAVLCVSGGGQQSEICHHFGPLDVRMVPDPSVGGRVDPSDQS